MENGEGGDRKPGRIVQAMAMALVILRTRNYRRNLLFGLTLLTVFLVFGGVVILGDGLMKHPLAFTFFWGICFLLVLFVLILALYDLRRVRHDHRQRMHELESQLARAAAEARDDAGGSGDQDD